MGVCQIICCEWGGGASGHLLWVRWGCGCVRASVVGEMGVRVCQGICCEWGGGVSGHLL